MLRWREIHPYNAVHVVAVEQPLDAARLARDIDLCLERVGLTGTRTRRRPPPLRIPRRRRRTRRSRRLPGRPTPTPSSGQEMERQLNAPFAATGPIDPFRFFAVDAGSRFYLGVAYDHFIAGGDSIVVLLKRIADRTRVRRPAAEHADLYPPTFVRLFARHALSLVAGFPHLAGMPRRLPARGAAAVIRGATTRATASCSTPSTARNSSTLGRVAAKAWGVTATTS